MRTGKLTNEQLDRLILNKLKHTRSEVVCSPSVGVDCTAVRLDGGVAVLSCDPITAAESGVGRLTVNVSCNDAAAAGAEPIGLMVTFLLPESVTERDIDELMDELIEAAAASNVDIIGGHTEITSAVTRIVTCATVIARPLRAEPVTPKGMRPRDDVIITKHAGLEGALLLAAKAPEDYLTDNERAVVQGFADRTSVVREGLYAAQHGATAMHDVTEGGILGALWEMSTASGIAIEFCKSAIPVHPVTVKLCWHFGIDPYKLISSGCMLIACPNGAELVEGLRGIGVEAAIIGKALPESEPCLVTDELGCVVDPPEADEIYKAI